MRLLLIRHGESTGNVQGLIQGWSDCCLTPTGEAQVEMLAERLVRSGWEIDIVYSCDLARSADTARIIAASLGIPLVLDSRLRGYQAGILTDVPRDEMKSLHPDIWKKWQQSNTWVSVPDEEGPHVFHERLAAMVSEILQDHMDKKRIALVSHGTSLGMLLVHLLQLNPAHPAPFGFDNASLSVVEFSRRGPLLVRLNDTCHLGS